MASFVFVWLLVVLYGAWHLTRGVDSEGLRVRGTGAPRHKQRRGRR